MPFSGNIGSNSPEAAAFTKALERETNDAAKPQTGNYHQQETAPRAKNSYSADSQLDHTVPMQEPKNYIVSDLNFGNRASDHMDNPGRSVPVQILQEAIEKGTAMPDPRGSDAVMYYIVIHKNGKKYNLEVLYDSKTNTIYHFMYTKEPIGGLPPLK